MANPADFKETNAVLAPPALADRAPPLLPALRTGGRTVTSWTLSALELEEVVRTGRIWVSIWSDGRLPPMLVSGNKADVI